MGVSGAKWCDFIVYTNKVIYVEKIAFDPVFWQNLRTEKVSCANFYSNPIVGPVGANAFVGSTATKTFLEMVTNQISVSLRKTMRV